MTGVRGATTDTLRKSYVPVPLDVFSSGRVLEFSVYARGVGNALQAVCLKGEALRDQDLVTWRRAGVPVLYVDTAEHRLYQQYAQEAMDLLMERADLPTKRKAELCYQTTRELIRDAAESSNVDSFAGEQRESWVNNLVTLICTDETTIDGMLSMLSHDYYTYTHMVNVSVMVTALAHRLGERDAGRLRLLASGGLLHDIGKLRISPDTLNKVGRLSGSEWAELKSHPDLGLEFLHPRPEIKPVELMMVHQHHEKLDGSGYPLGLVRSEITPEAQMTAVVDIYDALTCKRPYRAAMTHDRATAILREEAGAKINAHMVAAWTDTMGKALSTES